MTTALTIICFIVAIYYAYQGVIYLRGLNKFMRDLEAKQRLRREKAEKLKGIKL